MQIHFYSRSQRKQALCAHQHSAQAHINRLALDVHYSGSQLDAMLDRDPSPSPPVAVNRALLARNIFSKRSLSNGL